jgi:hypothetical protein
MLSNLLWNGSSNPPNPAATIGDPETPIFTAGVGDKVRFRMTHPFGTGTSQVFTVHGHVWQRNPYKNDSKEIGENKLSQWLGSRDNHGSTDHFDLLVGKAGGEGAKAGDYLYTVYLPGQASLGAWGLFRVGPPGAGPQSNAVCQPEPQYVPPAVLKEQKEQFRFFNRLPASNDVKDPKDKP